MENSLLILMNGSFEVAHIKFEEIKEFQVIKIKERRAVKISVISSSKKEYYYILREDGAAFIDVLNSIDCWRMAANHRARWFDNLYIPNELTLDITKPLKTSFKKAPSRFLCLIDGGWEKLIPVEIITGYVYSDTSYHVTPGEFTLIIQTKIGDHEIVRTDRFEFLKILGAFQNWFVDSKNTKMLKIFQKATNKILLLNFDPGLSSGVENFRRINIEEIQTTEIIYEVKMLRIHLTHWLYEIKRQDTKSFHELVAAYLAWKNSPVPDAVFVVDEVEKISSDKKCKRYLTIGDYTLTPGNLIGISQRKAIYYELHLSLKDGEIILYRETEQKINDLHAKIADWAWGDYSDHLVIDCGPVMPAEEFITRFFSLDQLKEDTFKIKSFLGLKKEDFKDVIVSLSGVPVTGIVSTDDVNHPDHYKTGGIETIDYMKAKSTPEEFRGYLKNCVLKYVSRANYKGDARKDLAKAKWYLDYLLKEVEEHEKRFDNAVEKTKQRIAAIYGVPFQRGFY